MNQPARSEITHLLNESSAGSAEARDRLLELVYVELHAIARSRMRQERDDHTLSATALVNETYMKLFRGETGAEDSGGYANRAHFFSAAATAMRRILVDHARARRTEKRGGGRRQALDSLSLNVLAAARCTDPEQILSLDEAISRLEQVDERSAAVLRLRFFAGLEQQEIAELFGVSERTVKRDWAFARAYLHQALSDEKGPT